MSISVNIRFRCRSFMDHMSLFLPYWLIKFNKQVYTVYAKSLEGLKSPIRNCPLLPTFLNQTLALKLVD